MTRADIVDAILDDDEPKPEARPLLRAAGTARDAAGRIRSYARQQLCKRLSREHQDDFARFIGCSQSELSKIANGLRRPNLALAVALEVHCGIRAVSWFLEEA